MNSLTAWVLSRHLSGLEVNGEAEALSGPWRRLSDHLAALPVDGRLAAWDGFRQGLPDPDQAVMDLAAVDPEGPAPESATKRSAHLGDLAAVQAASRFIWQNWLVRGHVNLLSSDPKVGKTHLVLDLARRIWFGEPWPDGQDPTFPEGTKTLWIPGDRHQDELRERAAAFGLPPEAVRLNATPEEAYGGWDLDNPDNISRLRELIDLDRPALVVIDTLWRATRRRLRVEEEVNELMTPILTHAQESDTCILALMHLSKDGDTLGRRLEALGRSVLKLTWPDSDQPDRRRLSVLGNFKQPPDLGMTLRDDGADFDSEPPQTPEGGRPGGRPGKRSGRPKSEGAKAEAWLRDQLQQPARVVHLRTAWEKAGFSTGAMYRACEAIGAEETEIKGQKGLWWRIPEAACDA